MRSQGGDILVEDNVLAVCFPCHVWIQNRPAAAKEKGLLRGRWGSGQCDETGSA